MTRIRRGMVLDLNLDPVRGSETGKVRPCVVVTNDTYNQRVPVIQVTPITARSEKKARIVSNVEIEPSPRNGASAASTAVELSSCPVQLASTVFLVRAGRKPGGKLLRVTPSGGSTDPRPLTCGCESGFVSQRHPDG